mgnify:FL=1
MSTNAKQLTKDIVQPDKDVGCVTRELGGSLIDSLDAAGAEGGVIVV